MHQPGVVLRRFIVVAAVTIAGCQPAAAPAGGGDAAAQAGDIKAVEAVLHGWYDAAERQDSVAWKAAMLPEFFIVEDTNVFDKAAITKMVVEGFPVGRARATLSDFRTQVRGDVAWSTFRNTEDWTPNVGKPDAPHRFIESVVFRRVDGAWKMERYHATAINRR
ncbi:MAG: nuclear transport factor 2 family protein [Gemmatimonadetes bacterium]|nr:nuclear transport factor 2 family protein [Gemmatimonadota bacterium]